MSALLFILGAAFGSFLNVVALRYDPDTFLFSPKVIGGLSGKGKADQSRCPHCGKALRWFELIPLLSFAVQGGRCRSCRARISFRYLLVELISGALFAITPSALPAPYLLPPASYLSATVWVAAFSSLLLMALIDIKWYLIPDEVHALLVLAGIGNIFLVKDIFGPVAGSFTNEYGLLFRPAFLGAPLLNHLAAAALGALFFSLIIVVTRGRGMGWGDVKLAAALGFLFGWPDILFVIVFAFIVGSVYGAWTMLRREKNMKSAVPFGPFLALGAFLVVLWGNDILHWYFGLFGW